MMHPHKAPAVEDDREIERGDSSAKPMLLVIGLPLALMMIWILMTATEISGPQHPQPGVTGDFVASPISTKITMLVFVAAMIISLGWSVFPESQKLPLFFDVLGLVALLGVDFILVDPQTPAGNSFFLYVIPSILTVVGLAASILRLKNNEYFRVVFPPVILIVAVLGSILGGLTNPTAAAGLGAGGAILLAATRLSGDKYKNWPMLLAAITVVVLLLISSGFDLRMQVADISGENQVAIFFAAVCY